MIPSADRSKRQAGTSLMELMFGLAITGFALIAIVYFISKSKGGMSRNLATLELIDANERISSNLHNALASNIAVVGIYPGSSPDFSGLHAVMAQSLSVSGAPSPVSFTLEPILSVDTVPDFSGDASDMSGKVGNELYFVSTLPPVTVTVNLTTSGTGTVINASNNTSLSSRSYVVAVDRLQFVALYLTQSGPLMTNGVKPLRLVEWRSRPYVSWTSLSQSAQGSVDNGAYLTATCAALVPLGYTLAIDTQHMDGNPLSNNATPGYFCYTLANSGSAPATPATPPGTFAQSSWAYIDEYSGSQALYMRGITNIGRIQKQRSDSDLVEPESLSFAYNSVTAPSTSTPLSTFISVGRDSKPLVVPAMATVERGLATNAGFPGGFEVLVFGDVNDRKIILRHVLMMANADVVNRNRQQFLALEGQDYMTCITQY
jgi:hypothetical protein